MDLDVCVDDRGNPYLGHPKEYHEKTRAPFFASMPLWEAVKALADSNIPVIVDCKHLRAWPLVEDVVRQLGPERCLVHSFVSELKCEAGRMAGEPDFTGEWSSVECLRTIKRKFMSLTTTASAKWLPADIRLARLESIAERSLTRVAEAEFYTKYYFDPDIRYFGRAGKGCGQRSAIRYTAIPPQ